MKCMSNVRPIVQYPNPILKTKTVPVDPKTDRDTVKTIVAELKATCLHFEHCAGLAANQIAHSKRIIVIKKKPDQDDIWVLINPTYTVEKGSKPVSDLEGCMSIKEITAMVKRSPNITLTYLDESLTTVKTTIDDPFIARVIQHEVDHLDGILFIDRLSSLQKKKIQALLKK